MQSSGTAPADHYATLGLERRCSLAQIRSAYRLLVKQHHPDVNQESAGAMARAQELNAAYSVLSDPARRRTYDRALDAAEASQRSPPTQKIERNISKDVHLRTADFIRGTDLEVQVADPGNPGELERYDLQVPAGSAPGARFRLPRAAPVEGSFVVCRLRAMPGGRFKVRGSDLQTDLRISARRAAEGGNENVQSATGTMLRVNIPARVKRGELIRLAGEGLPKPRGGRGDLLVRVTYRPEVRVVRSGR
jgi:DnaJ-class molecular chaperone